jgi:hypothetical protein
MNDGSLGGGLPRFLRISSGRNLMVARAAGRDLRALAKELKLGRFDWDEWKSCRDEGRR